MYSSELTSFSLYRLLQELVESKEGTWIVGWDFNARVGNDKTGSEKYIYR